MPNYNDFMMRHGEFGVQALIEQLERYECIASNHNASLEDRWEMLMQSQRQAA